MHIVQYLLQQHADITIRDNDGDTALHYCEDADVARVLIEHGADPLITNEEGELPIQVAHADGRQEMVAYLRQFTPDVELEAEGLEDVDGDGEPQRVVELDDILQEVERRMRRGGGGGDDDGDVGDEP